MNKSNINKTVRKLITVFALAALTAMHASYALTLNDPGVVGAAKGQAGDTTSDEPGFAQNILDLVGLGTSLTAVPGQGTVIDGREYWNSTLFDYSGTLTGGGQGTDLDQGASIAAFDYVLGKYDGQNAGYVLFHVGDYMTASGSDILPQFSFSIWGNNSGQYELSHIMGFNAVSTPDGGTTAIMLGLGFLGIAAFSRARP